MNEKATNEKDKKTYSEVSEGYDTNKKHSIHHGPTYVILIKTSETTTLFKTIIHINCLEKMRVIEHIL